MPKNKKNIGVSSCLLGNFCRYDGELKKDDFIVNTLSKKFNLIPFCPEAGIFETPREAIILTKDGDKFGVRTRETKIDVLDMLKGECKRCVDEFKKEKICGFILKSKSPSCGMNNVKQYDFELNEVIRDGIGFFAKEILGRYPDMLVLQESDLVDIKARKKSIASYKNNVL